jgi:hypothetical protein
VFGARCSSILTMAVCPKVAAMMSAVVPGLTLFHFSAQLEPCLTQENTLHPLITP